MSVVVIVVCFTQPFTLSLLVVVCCHYLFALKATFALEVHVVFTIWYFMNPFFLQSAIRKCSAAL